MRTFAAALAVAFSLTLIAVNGCGGGKTTGRDLSEDAKQLVAGNNTFAFELYGRLKETDRNLFFSPYCISECLAMTYAGARGDTEKQMRRALHFQTNDTHSAFAQLRRRLKQASAKRGIELNIANGIWTQTNQPLLPAYTNLLRRDYEAEVRQVNFAADGGPITEEINAWANTKTKGKIPEVVPRGLLDRLSRQVLVNAIYFKGTWSTKFDPERTRESEFQVGTNDWVKCPMMHTKGKFRAYSNHERPHPFQVIELPYAGKEFSLIAVLPALFHDLDEFERRLNEKNLASWLSSLQEIEIDVVLPKFRLRSDFNLEETLAAMGMPDAFDGQADLSRIDGTTDGYISFLRHAALAEINEEGTTAAAATVAHVRTKGMGPLFLADHPFLFLIRDNRSGSILFLGRLMDPTAG